MKKTCIYLLLGGLLWACNSPMNQKDGDASDTTRVDSVLQQIDTTIDKGVDKLQQGVEKLQDRVNGRDSARLQNDTSRKT